MQKSVLDEKHFHDEEAAYAYLEARIWPNGPVCPKCGGFDRIGKMKGKSTRIGVYKCYQCRKPFRATVGTVFEASHVPLRLWLQAVHLMASSKKGISANQLHRVLGVTLKTAWFMAHRIREAMRALNMKPMGGEGQVVEVDETFIGRLEGQSKNRKGGYAHKNVVLTWLSAAAQRAASISIAPALLRSSRSCATTSRVKARLMTDEAKQYKALAKSLPATARSSIPQGIRSR